MRETRLRKILNQAAYEAVIEKYREFIRKGEKEKALGLKTIVYANLYPKLREDGSNHWRNPNDFLYELCTINYVFDCFYTAVNTPNYHMFGVDVQTIRTKLV